MRGGSFTEGPSWKGKTVVTNMVEDLIRSRHPLSRLISLIPNNLWKQIAFLFSFVKKGHWGSYWSSKLFKSFIQWQEGDQGFEFSCSWPFSPAFNISLRERLLASPDISGRELSREFRGSLRLVMLCQWESWFWCDKHRSLASRPYSCQEELNKVTGSKGKTRTTMPAATAAAGGRPNYYWWKCEEN